MQSKPLSSPKRFRTLWHSLSLPSLHFDIADFYSRSTSPTPRCSKSRHHFAQFISHALLVRPHSPLQKLVLEFEYTDYEKHEPYMQNWIRNAINLSVSELVLGFRVFGVVEFCNGDSDVDSDDERHGVRFNFHLADIGERCIKVLKLYHCFLVVPLKSNPIEFVSLVSLELDVFKLEDDELCCILDRCVNMETLKLEGMPIHAPGGLRIYSATIKELYLRYCWNGNFDSPLDLDICCPSLEKISLILVDVGKCIIKDTTLLVEAWVDFMSCFKSKVYYKLWEAMLSYISNISSLRVWDELLDSNEVPAGCEQFASNVKHLELYISYNKNDLVGLSALLKLLPKLEILGLHNRGTEKLHDRSMEDVRGTEKLHDRGMEDANKDYWQASTVFNMPCLRKVILRKYQKTKGERHFIKLFRNNGTVLEKIKLLHFSNMEEDEK